MLVHPGDWFMPTLVLGLSALAIVAWMGRTKFGSYAALVALVVPTVALLDHRHRGCGHGQRRR